MRIAIYATLCLWLVLVANAVRAAEAPIIAAAAANDMAAVNQMISSGAEIEARDAQGRTALLAATHANAIEAALGNNGLYQDHQTQGNHGDDTTVLRRQATGQGMV